MPDASRHIIAGILASFAIAISAAPTAAQTPRDTIAVFDVDSMMAASANAAMQWTDLKAEGFNPGAKLAVIHGNPAGTGDYTVRLQFPDGYRFPVHWHPKAEHVTVLTGSFILGMGGAVNAAAEKTYGPGDFLYLPARHPHFGGAKGITTIQLHGMGPFTINLGAPPK